MTNTKFCKYLPLIAWLTTPGILAVSPAVLAESTIVKPTYQQARALYDQLKQPISDTGLFHKKSFKERVAYMDSAKALRDKAEKMFGVPSSCFSAASLRYEYTAKLHDYANRFEGRVNGPLDWLGVTDPMYLAFGYGESTAACYNDVEVLEKRK